jgi:hypothetical protein
MKSVDGNNSDKSKSDRFQWWRLWIQVGLLLATTGAFCAAAYYASIASRTLTQIQKQTISAQTGAAAAKSAADTASETLNETKRSTRRGEDITRIAANAAKKSADVAEKTMTGAQRPWLSVRLSTGGGLTFDDQGGVIPISFRIKNIGRSPALATEITAKVVLGFGPNNAIAERNKMLAGERKSMQEPKHALGHILFPGEEFAEVINFTMSREYIRTSQKEMAKSFKGENPASLNFISPFIVGYVRYGFSFDESVHRTAFMEEVCRIDPLHPNGCFVIEPDAGDIPADMLILRTSELGSYAD